MKSHRVVWENLLYIYLRRSSMLHYKTESCGSSTPKSWTRLAACLRSDEGSNSFFWVWWNGFIQARVNVCTCSKLWQIKFRIDLCINLHESLNYIVVMLYHCISVIPCVWRQCRTQLPLFVFEPTDTAALSLFSVLSTWCGGLVIPEVIQQIPPENKYTTVYKTKQLESVWSLLRLNDNQWTSIIALKQHHSFCTILVTFIGLFYLWISLFHHRKW